MKLISEYVESDLVISEAAKLNNKLCWFSTDELNPLVQAQFHAGKPAVFVRGGYIVYHQDGLFEEILPLSEVPMTMNGAAQHNVQNALGVVGLCKALKLPLEAIRQGLRDFGSDAKDNPGRGNMYQVNGAKIMVDFAHNEHSMRAVVDTVNQLPSKRKRVMFSHAGDRSDEEIRDLTKAVDEVSADNYIIAEIEQYLRGREFGDIPRIAGQCLSELGVPDTHIEVAPDPLAGTKLALRNIQPGDLVLLFVLADREQVDQYLNSLAD